MTVNPPQRQAAATRTMSRNKNLEGSQVQTVSGISDDHIKLLKDHGVKTLADFATLSQSDVDTILGKESRSFTARRRLTRVARYIEDGRPALTVSSSYQTIVGCKPGLVTTTDPIITQPKPHQTNIQLNLNDFPTFSRDIKDQGTYKIRMEAVPSTLSYRYLLDCDAASINEKLKDKELYNVLKLSFLDGKAYSLISDSLKDSNGNTLPESGRTA